MMLISPEIGAIGFILAASMSVLAAVAHLVCAVIGARGYRFLGAGERMARAAEAGSIRPAMMTVVIAGVLFIFAAYALGAAGVTTRLPLTTLALPAICAVYLVRAACFPFLRPIFPENSDTFWWVSSGVCLAIGLLHLVGLLSN